MTRINRITRSETIVRLLAIGKKEEMLLLTIGLLFQLIEKGKGLQGRQAVGLQLLQLLHYLMRRLGKKFHLAGGLLSCVRFTAGNARRSLSGKFAAFNVVQQFLGSPDHPLGHAGKGCDLDAVTASSRHV